MKDVATSDRQIIVMLDAVQEHALRNQFTIIVGFCEAMIHDLAAHDPVRRDVNEIRQAADAALHLLESARVR